MIRSHGFDITGSVTSNSFQRFTKILCEWGRKKLCVVVCGACALWDCAAGLIDPVRIMVACITKMILIYRECESAYFPYKYDKYTDMYLAHIERTHQIIRLDIS